MTSGTEACNVILPGVFIGSYLVLDPDMVTDAMKRIKRKDVEFNVKAFARGKEFSSGVKKSQNI